MGEKSNFREIISQKNHPKKFEKPQVYFSFSSNLVYRRGKCSGAPSDKSSNPRPIIHQKYPAENPGKVARSIHVVKVVACFEAGFGLLIVLSGSKIGCKA